MVWFALWHPSQIIRVEDKDLRITDLHPLLFLLQSCDSFIVNKWRVHILAPPPFRAVCFKRKWMKVKTAPIWPGYEAEMSSLFFAGTKPLFCLCLSGSAWIWNYCNAWSSSAEACSAHHVMLQVDSSECCRAFAPQRAGAAPEVCSVYRMLKQLTLQVLVSALPCLMLLA